MAGPRADVPVGSVLGTSHGLCISSAFLKTVKQNYLSEISDRKNGFRSLICVGYHSYLARLVQSVSRVGSFNPGEVLLTQARAALGLKSPLGKASHFVNIHLSFS